MGPSKKKGSVRRQVLDLNTREDSPSRPTWQTKYQHVLPVEGAQQNGDGEIPAPSSPCVKNNPLSGLLMNYNSDSDSEETTQKPSNNLNAKVEDFLKEIQSISVEIPDSTKEKAQAQTTNKSQNEEVYPSAFSSWQQCYDQNSGYYYYWNIETNEVTWEMPTCLKTAITSVTAKQQQQPQLQQQQQPPPKLQKKQQQPTEQEKKKVCKYPWQTESDSEEEKIEMITFFGSQSGDESDNEQDKNSKKSNEKVVASKLPNEHISLAPEDPERINESSYETSSLLAHGVQDTGPPGDESFHAQKESIKVPGIRKKEETSNDQIKIEISGPSLENKNTSELNNSVQSTVTDTHEMGLNTEKVGSNNKSAGEASADDVIAQIEKETPPDYGFSVKSDTSAVAQKIENVVQGAPDSPNNPKTSSFALIANYGDDSESEESNVCEKRKSNSTIQISSSKPIFPIKIPQETNKPIFPCAETETPKVSVEIPLKEKPHEPEPVNKIYNIELELSDPTVHKAFKRKKRIEFATTVYGPSTSTAKPISPVKVPTTQYNLDPDANDHHGFGFNALKATPDTERKTYKNSGGIQFVKGETINLNCDSATKEKSESELDSTREPKANSKDSVKSEEIEEAATLLREKVHFLIGGNNEISPIQQMAIELETLVLAWQSGVLTPSYLLRWLNDKCGELIRHEKTAAPAGWTCLWDRKSKRYFYRNSTTKAIQWEYPCVEEKLKTKEDTEDGGDEMDICDTPPHLSPVHSEKQTDETPSTPPPPVISDVSENASSLSPTPQPPSPPHISFSSELESSSAKYQKKKKRKADEMITSNEVDAKTCPIQSSSTATSCDQSNKTVEGTPPLPPMPPPPPPPPDESPPPLPDSPPPLPLDPDQPLPPGVDEPEYSLYRTKHSYKKSQPDSAAYSAELMLTYGYGLPVQPVVPSGTQAITLPMQPLEYHTYMPDPTANPYLVQSAPSAHVIHCPAKKPKPSLTSELVSFYSDLAELDTPSVNTNSDSNSHKVPSTIAPPKELVSTVAQTTSTATTVTTTANGSVHHSSSVTSSTTAKGAESTTSNGVYVKKKKKAKTSTGLALKKKGVSSLVAKWQQVQQEVRRDFSDDDDDLPANR